jgi:pimeloyl-ACP methyl ester carboxylesterase
VNDRTYMPVAKAQLELHGDAPDWYRRNMAETPRSLFTDAGECPIHFLLWPGRSPAADRRGLLFIHGGGAHAHWWSFLAPFFTDRFRVAAMDLSGMGDSGRREDYDAAMRSGEIAAVLKAAGLSGAVGDDGDARPFIIGHSFGGYQGIRFARFHGSDIAGLVIVDSPIRPESRAARRRRAMTGPKSVYDSFEEAVRRFRLLPPQDCNNEFLVEHIARHSLMRNEDGKWTWKFHEQAMGAKRWDEPFAEHFAALSCRRALIYGEHSALLTPPVAAHMAATLAPGSPVVEIPDARHHLILDQPLAFTAALRTLLAAWCAADAERS